MLRYIYWSLKPKPTGHPLNSSQNVDCLVCSCGFQVYIKMASHLMCDITPGGHSLMREVIALPSQPALNI